jgi:hypothetical protein
VPLKEWTASRSVRSRRTVSLGSIRGLIHKD